MQLDNSISILTCSRKIVFSIRFLHTAPVPRRTCKGNPVSQDKIDVHTHHVPPPYLAAFSRIKPSHMDGLPIAFCSEALSWNMKKQIAHQDFLNISKAYLSISSPGTHLTPGDDRAARELTKACNDWTYDQMNNKDFENRIGMFASLPLPDVSGSVAEIRRLKTELGLSSFIVMTNAHGIYLGDESLDEVWKELDDIKAVVSIHPTAPGIRVSGSSLKTAQIPSFRDASTNSNIGQHPIMVHGNPLLSSFFDPLIEYQFETARAVTSLLLKDSFKKYPNIRYIVPHAGATLPSILDRVLMAAPLLRREGHTDPQHLRDLLNRSCYFDLAGVPFPNQIQGLLPHLSTRPRRQLMYGSDFPWTSTQSASARLKEMEESTAHWDLEDQDAICWGNAVELMRGTCGYI